MSKRKKKTPAPEPQTPPTQDKTAPGKERRNLAKHSTILFVVTAIALLAIFLGRWVYAITEGYFASFVQRDASVSEAVSHMDGLEPTIGESERMLPLQQEWDLFTSSRLREEATVTAADGVTLHGYLYDEGSDVTVEYDKLIDRQLERAAVTVISGFAKVFPEASRVLEV